MSDQIVMTPLVEMTAAEREALRLKRSRLRSLREELRDIRAREESLEWEIAELRSELGDE